MEGIEGHVENMGFAQENFSSRLLEEGWSQEDIGHAVAGQKIYQNEQVIRTYIESQEAHVGLDPKNLIEYKKMLEDIATYHRAMKVIKG